MKNDDEITATSGLEIDQCRGGYSCRVRFAVLLAGWIQLSAELFAALCFENRLIGVALGFRWKGVLIQVRQEIRFNQDLIVNAVNGGIGVVVTHKKSDAADICFRPSQASQQFFRLSGAQLLLVFADTGAVFGLGGMDADVVAQCGGFQHRLGVCIQSLRQSNEMGECVDL